MQKELLIMRHAKSSWADESLTDHERPLNERGLSNAPAMADYIRDQGFLPDLILTSSANRAHSTAEIVFKKIQDGSVLMEVIDDFYLAPPSTYIDVLGKLDDRFNRPMVIGHNPGLEGLVNALTQDHEFMPTAAIALIRFNFERWMDFDTIRTGHQLVGLYRPKEVL